MSFWVEEHKQRVIAPKDWQLFAEQARREHKTIVTLNGSFDLLHAGHLHIIYEASKQADLLIVALNSDASIQQYKSPDRPIIPLQYRIELMTALRWVDAVTWFEETTPIHFLQSIKPDVHANGAEYGDHCIEKETVEQNGGKLHIVDLVPGLSTSAIINKIEQSYAVNPL